MITSKKQMINIMRNCDGADTLTREQKFQVFSMFVIICSNKVECPKQLTNDSRRFGDHDDLQLQRIAWYDRQGRRHNFEIESDRGEKEVHSSSNLWRHGIPKNVVVNNVQRKR